MPRPNHGPKLKPNDKGIYEIRWSDNGRSQRLSTRTKNLAEAQQALAGFLTEAERPENQPDLTVSDLLTAYLDEHVASHCTDTTRQTTICQWLRFGLGNLPADALTDRALRDYQDKRRRGVIGTRGTKGRRGRSGVGDATLRRELTTLIAAYNHGLRTRRLTAAQIPYIALPADSAPRDFFLTQSEANVLLKTARNQSDSDGRLTRADRYLHIALATAARKTSILELTWDLVDFDAGLIHYDQLPGARTKKRRVPVPIADWLLPTLERAYAEKTNAYVLDNNRDIRRGIEWLCKRVVDETGNERYFNVTPHSLRHTAATHMAQAGIGLFFIAGVLGDTVATVTRVYAKHSPDYLREAVNATALG